MQASEQRAEGLPILLKFNEEEWEAFGISGLRMKHFIKAGDKYFKPSVEWMLSLFVTRLSDALH